MYKIKDIFFIKLKKVLHKMINNLKEKVLHWEIQLRDNLLYIKEENYN